MQAYLAFSRQGGDEARAVALEASWAVTNLAALEHDVVEAVAPTAPLLVAHLNRASGYAVSEQCAWALGNNQRTYVSILPEGRTGAASHDVLGGGAGNMAGDCSSLAATVAASGAVLPLARLLLCAATTCPCKQLISAAHTAAWALSNILWGLPSQVRGSFSGCKRIILVKLRRSPLLIRVCRAGWNPPQRARFSGRACCHFEAQP